MNNVSVAFPIVGGILFTFSFSTLMRAAFTDPGIIPRSLQDELDFWDTRLCNIKIFPLRFHEIVFLSVIYLSFVAYFIADSIAHPGDSQSTANRNVARYLDVPMKEHTLKLKWCHTCKLFRPPRSSHCSICDNCIGEMETEVM